MIDSGLQRERTAAAVGDDVSLNDRTIDIGVNMDRFIAVGSVVIHNVIDNSATVGGADAFSRQIAPFICIEIEIARFLRKASGKSEIDSVIHHVVKHTILYENIAV